MIILRSERVKFKGNSMSRKAAAVTKKTKHDVYMTSTSLATYRHIIHIIHTGYDFAKMYSPIIGEVPILGVKEFSVEVHVYGR